MGLGNKGVVEVKGYWSGDGFQVFVSLTTFTAQSPLWSPTSFYLPGVGGLPQMLSISAALPPPATTDQVRGYPADLLPVESSLQ